MNVSRETLDRFDELSALVLKWNSAINLVSKSSIRSMQERHFADSAQLFSLAGKFENWVDLGSGGGFPALVIAILAAESSPSAIVTMVESDNRKCEFLRHSSRQLSLKTVVINDRIENVKPLNADVVSARALAPLKKLCEYFDLHKSSRGIGIFPKGVHFQEELDIARQNWNLEYKAHPSLTDPSAVVLEVKDISRV